MDAEIQFGAVSETPARIGLRPDRDRHRVVVPCGAPEADDLPVFVDLDALQDMESHAASDTRVELGGVLLGGQFEDADGRPFVVVTDCLRARHYEATKGSFKFTHDTWSEITREREAFPAETQMVGWYHTHPDWGVFLSGMDLFICEHFFDKRLDVAFVIDPCRRDRGWFQWTSDPRQPIRRTGGFFLMTSRFRRAEAERFAAVLGGADMPTERSATPLPATVVTIPEPRSTWLAVAVIGLLSMQFVLVALLGWRLLGGRGDDRQLAALERLADANDLRARQAAQDAVWRRVLADLRGTTEPEADELVKQRETIDELRTTRRADLRAFESLERELAAKSTEWTQALDRARQDHERLEAVLARLKEEKEMLRDEKRTLQRKHDDLAAKWEAREKEAPARARWLPWATGAALGLAVGGVVGFVWKRPRRPVVDPESRTAEG